MRIERDLSNFSAIAFSRLENIFFKIFFSFATTYATSFVRPNRPIWPTDLVKRISRICRSVHFNRKNISREKKENCINLEKLLWSKDEKKGKTRQKRR
jgi:hypothetical protein